MLVSLVTHYDSRPERQFGFARSEQQTIWFHLSRRMRFYCDGGSSPARQPDNSLPQPKKGDEIVLFVEEGNKGPRARYWGFKADYDSAIKAIEKRPTYRFIQRTGRVKVSRLHSELDAQYKTLWEGQDLSICRLVWNDTHCYNNELSARFFMVYIPEHDAWEECNDPR